MQCDWEIGERRDDGRVLHTCRRPGCPRRLWVPPTSRSVNAACWGWPRWHEWGEWVALLLAAFWITPRVWSFLVWRLGLVEVPEDGCSGCDARKFWLNTLGGRLATSTHWFAQLLARWLVKRATPPT